MLAWVAGCASGIFTPFQHTWKFTIALLRNCALWYNFRVERGTELETCSQRINVSARTLPTRENKLQITKGNSCGSQKWCDQVSLQTIQSFRLASEMFFKHLLTVARRLIVIRGSLICIFFFVKLIFCRFRVQVLFSKHVQTSWSMPTIPIQLISQRLQTNENIYQNFCTHTKYSRTKNTRRDMYLWKTKGKVSGPP